MRVGCSGSRVSRRPVATISPLSREFPRGRSGGTSGRRRAASSRAREVAHHFIAVMDRWPPELSLGEHIATDVIEHPLTPTDVDDEISAMRIATLSLSDVALRTSYLMVHNEMERRQ